MIRFDNVNKWYGDYHALNDITAEVAQGEVVVVCGPSGSGKSTLIRTVNRLEEIRSGQLVVDGFDIHAKSNTARELNRMRSRIGFVFQSFNLFSTPLRAGEHRDVADAGAWREAGGGAGDGDAAARAGRLGQQSRLLPGAALRRSAAAGRHRARVGDGTAGDVVRRAHQRAQSGNGWRGAGRHAAAWPTKE